MNDTVIVTVSGDRAEETLEADRAQPVGRLLAGWARRCSSLPPARLAVVADDGDPLDPESTLAGAGACYGTTLRLVEQPMKPARAPDVVIEEPPPSLLHAASPEEPGQPGVPETNGHNGSVNHALARGDGPPDAAPAAAEEATRSDEATRSADRAIPAVPAPSDATPAGGTEPVGLPRRVGWARRRASAAASAVSRKPLPPAEAYAVAERPGPLSRWRRQMAATDYLAQLEQLVRRATIGESVLVAVVSPKGGVGKTTLTGLLASLLAEVRRDPVLALDANADFGNLAARLCPPEARGDTVAQLWSWAQARSVTPATLAGRLGQGPHGLRVVGTPAEADAMLAGADHGLYEAVLAWLAGFGGVILADCGTGLLDPPTRAALEAADQIVLVTDSAADTARLVVEAGRQLPAGRPCWLVANKVPSRGARVDLGSVRSALPDLAGSVVLPAVELAENVLTPRFRWEHAPRAWRAPVRELAAGLSAGWAGA